MFLALTIVDNFAMGLYAGLLTFGNILLPTLGAVAIFILIKGWTTLVNIAQTIFLQAIILFLLLIFGLFVWATLDAYLFETITWRNVKDDYESEFAGYLPVVFTEAILIPTFDFLLNRRKLVTE